MRRINGILVPVSLGIVAAASESVHELSHEQHQYHGTVYYDSTPYPAEKHIDTELPGRGVVERTVVYTTSSLSSTSTLSFFKAM